MAIAMAIIVITISMARITMDINIIIVVVVNFRKWPMVLIYIICLNDRESYLYLRI